MKERLIWLDSLKGCLILIVIFGHAIQYCLSKGTCESNYLWNLIYSFHMPTFMAASGFVNYRPKTCNSGYLTLIKRRSCQLLVPYLIWSCIKWMLMANHSMAGLTNIILKPDGYFWFLWVLWVILIIFIVGDYLSGILKAKQEVIIGSISLFLVIVMVFLNMRIIGFQFIAYYFIFYAFGYYCNKYRNLLTANKVGICFLFFVWFAMASFWNMHELPFFLKGIPFIPSALLQYAYRFATAFVAIYLIFSAAPMLLNVKSRANEKVAHIGQISLGIYVVHLMLIIPMSHWLVSVMPSIPMYLVVIISFSLAAIISIGLVELLSKNRYTSKYLLGKI